MPSYLDLALIAIVLISALLSMVRGFTREILAIASWAAAFVAAYAFYPQLMPYLGEYIHKTELAIAASVAIIFFGVLILVSIVTVRISDAILDSKVGPLDRTLGFVFGAVRGFALGVIAFMLFNYLAPRQQPEWVANAKTRPLLQASGEQLVAVLPDNLATSIFKVLQKPKTGTDEAPAEETDPAEASPATGAADPQATPKPAAPVAKPASGAGATDKQKLENLLGKGVAPPATTPKR
ncbi:CvpA family protein [Lichenihabitans sp. Uapishka_5]|uniref:CvpA family protein n=1 Tax=Lichenihabitans sp. Uapishka_5 TaxID=3037302 RepID=UPI0029E8131C|nr:CvpA family protein [Lichenihabitans sp. Uapishka_5]MDX7952811.1 CvpA family protein [Lichenihabitans sp. Uapishka_5]